MHARASKYKNEVLSLIYSISRFCWAVNSFAKFWRVFWGVRKAQQWFRVPPPRVR